jgi:hypothetical protein
MVWSWATEGIRPSGQRRRWGGAAGWANGPKARKGGGTLFFFFSNFPKPFSIRF